ncbi:MAG: hypothetical protein ACK4TF_06265 [Thermodesulfovibrionales bacterium]
MKVTIYNILNKKEILVLISCSILLLLLSVTLAVSHAQGKKPLPEFKDLKESTLKFISYYYNIQLPVPEQKILEKALSEIPAPCCSDHPALTC